MGLRICRQNAPPEQRSDLNLLNLCSWGPCLAALGVAPELEHPRQASARHGRSSSTHSQRDLSVWEPKFGGINPKASSGGGVCFADSEHKAVESLLYPKWFSAGPAAPGTHARARVQCPGPGHQASEHHIFPITPHVLLLPPVSQLCQPKRALPWLKQGRNSFVTALQAL